MFVFCEILNDLAILPELWFIAFVFSNVMLLARASLTSFSFCLWIEGCFDRLKTFEWALECWVLECLIYVLCPRGFMSCLLFTDFSYLKAAFYSLSLVATRLFLGLAELNTVQATCSLLNSLFNIEQLFGSYEFGLPTPELMAILFTSAYGQFGDNNYFGQNSWPFQLSIWPRCPVLEG